MRTRRPLFFVFEIPPIDCAERRGSQQSASQRNHFPLSLPAGGLPASDGIYILLYQGFVLRVNPRADLAIWVVGFARYGY